MNRSWMAHISAGLGGAALLGVLCFHFPMLLTSRDFRAVYSEDFARNLLLLGLVLSFTFGTVAALRRRGVKVAIAGVCLSALALFPAVKAWIQDLPVGLQFLLAVFLADLFQAGLNRIYHRVSFFWRFHVVHHSSRNLGWLAGSRVHIVEIVLTRSAVLLPLVDMVMGTFKRPPTAVWPEEYGVMKLATVPRGIWAQTLMPLGPKKTFEDHVGADTPVL